MDSLAEGVGVSQVLTYVERLALRGLQIHLHSFEKSIPSAAVEDRLRSHGVRWSAHAFGPLGARGGLKRVLVGARAVRSEPLVHARSDLAAASAVIGRPHRWLWDIRSLWADQRIALGAIAPGSPEEQVLRIVERRAARASDAVVTLSSAVLPVLDARHSGLISPKATVIPTCVDLNRFAVAEMPARRPIELLLAGTINAFYDVPTMVRLVRLGQERKEGATLRVLSPSATAWDNVFASIDAHRDSATPDEVPDQLVRSHVGLCVCRADAGVSLLAAMPTKVAEFLAVGRPVVVNAGLGDAGPLVEDAGAGVALRDLSNRGLTMAWESLIALIEDPATPARCRALAEQHFDVDRATDRLLDVYAGMS